MDLHFPRKGSPIVRRESYFLIVAVLGSLTLSAITTLARADRRVSEEALLFRRLRSGVATVFADGGHGSGFLVDSTGLVLTNEHVAGGGYRIRVKFEDSTRFDARLVLADSKHDVAVLRLSPDAVRGRAVLQLATPSDTMAIEGERVIAIGSPLNQEKVMTTGIVSKVQPTAIITDANINHGNSGGPLINLDGEVIAINTFLDPGGNGPGISGSISVSEIIPILDRARAMLDTIPVPSARRLPTTPSRAFPIDSLKTLAGLKKFDSAPYYVSDIVGTGKFIVVAGTPMFEAWRDLRYQVEMTKHSRARESRGGSSPSADSDPTRSMRDWIRYEGNYPPIVTLEFTPKVGETAGSVFGNILGAALTGAAGSSYYRGTHHMEYKADFRDVRVFRDSVEIEDVGRARVMQPMWFSQSTWSDDYFGADQARTGLFQCTQDWFAPDGDGTRWPKIRVELTSVDKPESPTKFELPEKTVRRLWDDFSAWRTDSSLVN